MLPAKQSSLINKRTLGAVLVILCSTIVFYWRILLTREFSLLTEAEGVNQAYSWFHFWVASIRQGSLPLWDPYTNAGRSFVGEMQTAAFYPLHLLLALAPFNENGVFSPRLYHLWIVFNHFLAACFMFALVREFRLSRFSAVVAALCFSLGGYVGHVPWPHMLESSIWLPLIVLFLLRALRASSIRLALSNAALGGLAFGVAILAGGMHVAMMQGLVVVSAGAFAMFEPLSRGKASAQTHRAVPALVVGTVLAIGLCIGAVQLLPSVEYSGQAIRFLGDAPTMPATAKIPHAYVGDAVWPHGLWGMLFSFGFNGNMGQGESNSYYLGVLPLIAGIIGIICYWRDPWLRYFLGLGAAAFLYALNAPSLLHGLLYTVTPWLWMAREPTRFVYLLGFSFAIIVGFGIEVLFFRTEAHPGLRSFHRIFTAFVILCAIFWTIPAVFGRPDIHYWTSFSLMLIFASYGLVQFVRRRPSGVTVRVLAVGMILFDLHAFDWTTRNTYDLAKTGANYFDRVMSARGAAGFLKSQQGLFRVASLADAPPNIGNLYGVPSLNGAGATLTTDFAAVMERTRLLNVRYLLRPASATEPGALYADGAWKVYENPGALPRAWIVHEARQETSTQTALKHLENDVNPLRTALVPAALPLALQSSPEGSDHVVFTGYAPGTMGLTVETQGRGLVVMSEMFYPGWRAYANGRETEIYRVNGAFRGVLVEPGKTYLTVRYLPASIRAGAVISAVGVLFVLAAVILGKRKARNQEQDLSMTASAGA